MRTKTGVVGRLALAWIALVMACSDSPSAATPGRGSAACNEWQSAYCGFAMKCQVSSANALCDQVKAIVCKSDTEAKQCADVLNGASCTQFPATCDVGTIADPAPAKKACEDFNAALCKRFDECDPGSLATCLEQANMTLPCDKVIGVTMAFEACMSEIPKIVCANPALPDVCRQVLLRLP
jgi:hypothetical protein